MQREASREIKSLHHVRSTQSLVWCAINRMCLLSAIEFTKMNSVREQRDSLVVFVMLGLGMTRFSVCDYIPVSIISIIQIV